MEKNLAQHKNSLPAFNEGLSKKDIAQLAEKSVHLVLEQGNVFQVAEALSAMEEFVKTVRKDERFIEFLRDELTKHKGRLITNSGAKIEMYEAGVKYDYSTNSEWVELNERISELTEQKRLLEENLKRIGQGRIIVDTETGEIIEGPFKNSKSTYRVTLARS